MDKEAVYRYTNIKMTQKFWHSNDGNPISSKQQHRSLIFFLKKIGLYVTLIDHPRT